MSTGMLAAEKKNEKIEPKDTVQISQEIPAEGTVTVTLAQIDVTRFKNYRKQATETHLMDLFGKIKEHKQLTPVIGAWLPNGKIGLIAGFCRYEAMERLAMEKLVREYNQANGKEAGQEGYISLGGAGFNSRLEREKILLAGGEWKAKYEAALKGYNILVRTIVVDDDADAALKNVVENTYDKPPLADLCDRIEDLLTHPEITQKRVARALKMSEPAVSQHRKIHACPEFMRKKFAGDLSELAKKPEDQVVIRQQLLTAVAEFERRLSLDPENGQSISFSHAREFSGAIMHTKEEMTVAGIAKALKDLVVMQDNGTLSTHNTPEYGVFMAKLRDAKRLGKKGEEEPAAAGAAAGATPTTPAAGTAAPVATHDLSSLSQETAARFDKAGENLHPAVSTGNQPAAPAATTAPTTPLAATQTPVVSKQPTLSPEDQARQAEIEASNAAADSPASDRMDELTGPSTESLIAAEGVDTPVAAPTDGQMKGKTTDAPVASKYRPKAPEKIEQAANRMLDYASDEQRATPIDQAGYLLASTQLFNAVGMEDAERAVNEAFVNFNEGLNKYLEALTNSVKEAKGEVVLKEIQALMPKFVRPSLAK
jgi:hypothetical protein